MGDDDQGPPHELGAVLIEALKALDMGYAIEPSSYFHEELKRLLRPTDTSNTQRSTGETT